MTWFWKLLRFLADLLTPADPNHVDMYGQRQAAIPEAFTVPEIPVAAALTSLPGIQMVHPPAEYFGSLSQAIEQFAAVTLRPEDRGGLVGIVTRRPDGSKIANAAIVQRIGDRGEIVGWLGKTWGAPAANGWETGLAWRQRW